jgi:hypothetical protein
MIDTQKVLNGAQMLTLMGGVDHPGAKMRTPGTIKVRDAATGGFKTRTIDGSGAFLVGELERLDQTSHQPLSTVTFLEDLPLRDDVTLGDEVTSFTQETFATPSGAGTNAIGQKRSAIGKKSTQIPEMEVDIDKKTVPLFAWGEGIAYSLPELESAAQIGRPIDQRKLTALDREFQLQSDAQMYQGWQGNGTFGLYNSPLVSATNLPDAAVGGGGPKWSGGSKTPTEILTDLANMVYTPWAASGFAVLPNTMALDPENLSYISTTMVAVAGTSGAQSILSYFLQSNICKNQGQPLRVIARKWLTGGGAGGTLMQQGTTNRAVVYHDYEGSWQDAYVRFPFLALTRTPVQFDGLWHKMYKWTRMGACEFVYPETVAYFDGL